MDCRVWIPCALLATLTLSGCAGARGSVAFNKLEYPVSMSPYVESRSGRVLSPDDMQVVGEVKYETKIWGMGYSLIPLTGEEDVSEPINQQVRSVRGDGVSQLSVAADYCSLNHVPLLNVLPVWPTCVDVSIQGQIYRENPARSSPGTLPVAHGAGSPTSPGSSQQAANTLPVAAPPTEPGK
jgi:hypothetical protein